MKKLFTTCIWSLLLFGGTAIAQDNTLPPTGNVGIGTLNPDTKLDVKGHVRIDSTLTVKDSILIKKDARILQDLKVEGQFYLPNISSSNNLNNAEILVRSSNGQIVKSTFDDVVKEMYSKQCSQDPNTDVINPVWLNGTNKIYVDCPQINVGIATNTPRVNLDVNGPIAGKSLSLGMSNPENNQLMFHLQVPQSYNPVGTSKVFLIENNQRELFQVNNDGIARSREFIVNLEQPWPDYVFSEKYELLPLDELENYIEKNGHLPNVPSATIVETEGVALGEMNKILLEKIEELTLYLLEQDKRLEELEKKLSDCNN